MSKISRRVAAAVGAGVLLVVLMAPWHPAPANAAVPRVSCPPDCGAVAAGDPLLVPYVTVNPGVGWLALPDTDVGGYVDRLEHNLRRGGRRPTLANVAAARWTWLNHRFGLLIVLVSSPSLHQLRLDQPAADAGDLCASSRGRPASQLVSVPGVPGSVSGLCAFPSGQLVSGATVSAFTRGDVAVLMEITSETTQPIDARTAAIAVEQQYQALPASGVVVSTDGPDWPLWALWAAVVLLAAGVVITRARRQRRWQIPFEALADAATRRRLALGVALLAVAGTMAFSMLDLPVLHGVGEWYESGFNDFWRTWASAAETTYAGGFAHVYGLDSALETAPAWLVVVAPVARLASGLPFPHPSPVTYPAAFWVAGPLFIAAVAVPLCAAERWLETLGVGDLRRRLVVLGTMAVTLPPIALFGHPEDLVALGAVLYGLLAALDRRPRAAGWWLGAALAFQFLAFLAVPMALALLARRHWWKVAARAVVVPAAFLAVPLAVAPAAVVSQLAHQKVYFDLGYVTPVWLLDPGVGAFARAAIALVAVGAGVGLARWQRAGRTDPANTVLWLLGLVFALRVAEPELVGYFLAPALALLPLSAARARWWRLAAASAVAIWLNWWLHVAIDTHWLPWLLLVAQLAVLGWLAIPPPSTRPGDEPDPAPTSSTRRAVTVQPARA